MKQASWFVQIPAQVRELNWYQVACSYGPRTLVIFGKPRFQVAIISSAVLAPLRIAIEMM